MFHFLLALFQTTVPPIATAQPWWAVLLGTAVPILSGWLAKLAADGIKQISTKYDALNSNIKLVVSLLIGFGTGWLATHFSGVAPLGSDIHGWTADALGGLITAILQSGLYRLTKNNQLAAQGSATLEQRAEGVPPGPKVQANRV
jgi:hypothetical protein